MDADTTHVLLSVAGERYAIPVQDVGEVVMLEQPVPVPGARPPALGLANLRGEIVPVADLAQTLGLPDGHPSRLVVVAHNGVRIALAVDAVLDVAAFGDGAPEHEVPCVRATALAEDRLVGLLDTDALLVLIVEQTG